MRKPSRFGAGIMMTFFDLELYKTLGPRAKAVKLVNLLRNTTCKMRFAPRLRSRLQPRRPVFPVPRAFLYSARGA